MGLNEQLEDCGFKKGYFYDCEEQVNDIIELTKNAKNILEIGFRHGCTTEIILANNPDAKVLSFDLGLFDSLETSKEFIDMVYSDRHTLILGDSINTLPHYCGSENTIFDVIFINGSRDNQIILQDIENCQYVANKDTIVVVNDTVYIAGWQRPWTRGATVAWDQCLVFKKIINSCTKQYCLGRGMSWGQLNVKF